jgi:hypothetical protein
MEREMRKTLAELELISHGRVPHIEGRVTGSKDHSPIMRVDEEAYPHEFWRGEWNAATTDQERREALEGAWRALEGLRRQPQPPDELLERGTLAWKRRIANDNRTSVAELARLHGISRRTVYTYRRKFREPERRAA